MSNKKVTDTNKASQHESEVSSANVGDAEALARKIHKYCEGLAHVFGYQTRKDTRNFDPDSKNGKLMIAVCEKILIDLAHKETS